MYLLVKILHKKDIQKKIQYGQLEKMYIRIDMYDKFVSNMSKLGIVITFKILRIDLKIKSFVEDREKKISEYGGVIGVTYY